MSSSPRILKVILASPGDVQKERDLVPKIIEQINRILGRVLNVRLELLRWETDAYPGFHPEGGQGVIDGVLKIEEADLLIGLFWTRFGRKIPSGETGTEHEIRRAIAARDSGTRTQIMLYFNDEPVSPSTLDPAQYAGIAAFREEMSPKGVYWDYQGADEFEELLRGHLANWLNAEHAVKAAPHPANP